MTELIWDGKYDKTTGKKVAPLRVALPFQTAKPSMSPPPSGTGR